MIAPETARTIPREDAFHVGAHVVGKLESFADADDFALVVEVNRNDGHVRFAGNAPKAHLPLFDFAAGTFWCESVPKWFVAQQELRGLFNDAGGVAALNGDDADPAEDWTEDGDLEERVFAEDANVDAESDLRSETPKAVPVTGVWCADEDRARKVWERPFHVPTAESPDRPAEPLEERVILDPGDCGWQVEQRKILVRHNGRF